ncbi:MAG: hypothetical protein AAF149_18010 [Bacteroidota bacterium]
MAWLCLTEAGGLLIHQKVKENSRGEEYSEANGRKNKADRRELV